MTKATQRTDRKKVSGGQQDFEHRPGDPPHRLTRTRFLTPEEAERDRQIREAVLEEFPPAPGSPAALLKELRDLLKRLGRERRRRGLSLADVAERSGIDRSVISRLENGRQPNPTVTTLCRYAAALGLQLSWSVTTAESRRPGKAPRGR
jgi:ribosome-binding protein aMBF1 (putative translation factor)